jgi:NADH dehydrogenase
MKIGRICVTGGSGFVGRHLCNRLSAAGYRLRVPTRDRERAKRDLILLPGLDLVQTDVHDPAQLRTLLDDCDAVINLVGILNERGRDGAGFRHAHVDLARGIAAACRDTGVRRVLQMSALNADAQRGASHYLRSKGEAEDLLHGSAGLAVTSFRPSVIFGSGDSFLNRFAALLRTIPLALPLACPAARFAPVYVGDVAQCMVAALDDPATIGRRIELCGPETWLLQELVAYTARLIGARRLIVPLPDWLSRLQAALFDFVPGKPFSTDNYRSAQIDSVCGCNDLPRFVPQPTPLDAVAPAYLAGLTARARYRRLRDQFHRAGG